MNINGFGKSTQEMINKFQQHIGFLLPDDYKEFLRESNGGITKVRYYTFFVEELNQKIPLNVLYGLSVEKREADLQVWYDEYSDDLLSNTIIIGDDLGSGMIVLINGTDMKGVYYWDHSYYFEQSSREKNIYKIADDFQAFIDGLKNP